MLNRKMAGKMSRKTAAGMAAAAVMAAALPVPLTVSAASDYDQVRIVTFEANKHEDADKALVVEAINEITREEIGTEVTIDFIPFSSYSDQINLMLSGGENLDLYSIFGFSEAGMISKGACYELNDLLAEYGQGIIENIGEEKIEAIKTNGINYYIPTLRDFYAYSGIVMRKDLVEKYEIDVDSIHTLEDLTPIFEVIHENEPDISVIAPQSASEMFESWDWDPCGDQANWLGVIMDNGAGTTIENLYETDEWRDICNTVYGWNQSGYMVNNVLNTTDSATTLMEAGTIFSYLSNLKLGYEEEKEASSGVPIVTAKICDRVQGTGTGLSWAMSPTTKKPEAAMKVLNMMYSDERIFNLLANGVEGVHYDLVDTEFEGETYKQCKTAEALDGEKSGWLPDQSWMWGNQMLGLTWVGTRPDIYIVGAALAQEFSPIPSDLGLTYSVDDVAAQYAACTNVLAKYRYGVIVGALEPEATLAQMNKELYDAGLQDVLDAKQAQLDAFLADK